MKRIFAIFTIMAVALSAAAADADIRAVKGKVKDSYNFWLYTPAQPGDSAALKPLVVFLHGASLCGSNLDRVRRYGTIDALSMGRSLDAYVIAPQNPGGAWNPRKVMALVEYMSATSPVDTARVYVIGMSLGGYGTLDVAATYPDRIAAAIGICGGASVRDLSGLARLPLWIIHGTGDRAVSVSQSDRVVEAVRASVAPGDSARLHYDRIKGMNHSRPARLFYMPAIYEWLMKHSLNDPGRTAQPTFPLTDQVFNTAYDGLKVPPRRSHRRHRRR